MIKIRLKQKNRILVSNLFKGVFSCLILVFLGCNEEKRSNRYNLKETIPCLDVSFSLPDNIVENKIIFERDRAKSIRDFCDQGEEVSNIGFVFSNAKRTEEDNSQIDFSSMQGQDFFTTYIRISRDLPTNSNKLIVKKNYNNYSENRIIKAFYEETLFLNEKLNLLSGYVVNNSDHKGFTMLLNKKIGKDYIIEVGYEVSCTDCDIDAHKRNFFDMIESFKFE